MDRQIGMHDFKEYIATLKIAHQHELDDGMRSHSAGKGKTL